MHRRRSWFRVAKVRRLRWLRARRCRPAILRRRPPTPARAVRLGKSSSAVKLFSAIAASRWCSPPVFFLRYSIDRGWLSPPVRMAIGIIVAIALLVVCE
jgi:hypothetical protein